MAIKVWVKSDHPISIGRCRFSGAEAKPFAEFQPKLEPSRSEPHPLRRQILIQRSTSTHLTEEIVRRVRLLQKNPIITHNTNIRNWRSLKGALGSRVFTQPACGIDGTPSCIYFAYVVIM